MKVRMADIRDLDALIRVRFDYFHSENWAVTDAEHVAITAQLKEYYPAHLNSDFFAALVEEEEGVIAATAFLSIHEKPANIACPTGKIATIHNVLTYPQYRRKGYATEVMKLLIAEAKRQNVSFIELSASAMGKPVYEKLGFRKLQPSDHTKMELPLL